jgi:phosphonate transport system permease protein
VTAAVATAEVSVPPRVPVRPQRRAWVIVVVALTGWSAIRAGLAPTAIVNERGMGQVTEFFTAAAHPVLTAEFVQLALREAATTLAYALVGTLLALVIGVLGGFVVSERLWTASAGTTPNPPARWVWAAARMVLAVPRSMHEVVFGLLLVNILGVDPLVAVLAIGVPFGAMTAKVFGELIDECPRGPEVAMRAAGAGRVMALTFGVLPHAAGDLLSYSFYRFECAIRSAAVLGIVGAGGLGFQLALSFQSLRYQEIWTLLWTLILISGLADAWSSAVRRRRASRIGESSIRSKVTGARRADPVLAGSVVALAAAVPLAWWWLRLDVANLWSVRARRLAGDFADRSWPPTVGQGGWPRLAEQVANTLAMAVLALALAGTIAAVVAFIARRRPSEARDPAQVGAALLAALTRFGLLVARAVPPPVWALLAVFAFRPGIWPGAIALGLYNLGVLGRLQAEVLENLDDRPARALAAAGARPFDSFAFATVPAVAGRFAALGLYRWEVALRETVMVGVVGVAGLGRRLAEQTSSFDHAGITSTLLALFALTVLVDLVSSAMRRSIR